MMFSKPVGFWRKVAELALGRNLFRFRPGRAVEFSFNRGWHGAIIAAPPKVSFGVFYVELKDVDFDFAEEHLTCSKTTVTIDRVRFT